MAQLVVQTAYPGDLLLSIPLLKQVRVFYPNEKIILLCRHGLGDFFIREGLADEVLEVNKKDPASMARVLRDLRGREWDRVFCPHESYRSALWVRSLKVKEFSVGFRKWWNWFAFTKRVEKPVHLPDALRQLSLLAAVNVEFRSLWERDLDVNGFRNSSVRGDISFAKEMEIPKWADMSLRSSNSERENVIYIAPGSVWPTKQWTKSGFVEVAKSLAASGSRVVFVGSPSESALCEELARDSGTSSLAGKTSIPQLVDLFRTGKALVSNDSGAMHAASVAGLPTAAVFGPTVLDFGFRPWQSRAAVVQLELSCRPCAAHGGKTCPIGTHACMRDLPPSRVLAALRDLVN